MRASIKGGLLSTDSAYQAALHDLIAADPAGAMSPKALLNYIAHEPYIRAPWKINDDLPGIRSAESNPPVRQSSIRLWPNPAQRTVWVELPGDLGLANAYLQHMDGRCSEAILARRWNYRLVPQVHTFYTLRLAMVSNSITN
ncbi:MAG: hypothetical protein IPI41_18990 [Flavobacteriales bacterium]|nr:hypothetical protein [Flavobacteriales bacterium]